jgi:hypothetical protein
VDDRLLRRLARVELARHAAVAQDDDAVGEPQDLGEIARREEHGHAAPAELREDGVDLLARAHVDAAGGLVEQQHLRGAREPLAERDLLLVAAREGRDRVPGLASNVQIGDAARGHPPLRPGVDQPVPRPRPHDLARREPGEREVLGHRHVEHDPLALAVLGQQRQAGRDRLPRRAERHGLARDTHGAGDGPLRAAEEGREQRGAPGSHGPGERDHLALVDRERHAADREALALCVPRAGEADLQVHDLERGPRPHGRWRGGPRVDAAADHERDHLGCGRLPRDAGAGGAPVAQHRDPVAEREDLVHAVRDVDRGRPRRPERREP